MAQAVTMQLGWLAKPRLSGRFPEIGAANPRRASQTELADIKAPEAKVHQFKENGQPSPGDSRL